MSFRYCVLTAYSLWLICWLIFICVNDKAIDPNCIISKWTLLRTNILFYFNFQNWCLKQPVYLAVRKLLYFISFLVKRTQGGAISFWGLSRTSIFRSSYTLLDRICYSIQKAVTMLQSFWIHFSWLLLFVWQAPFTHTNRKKLQEKIIKEKVKLPPFLSTEAHSLLKGVSRQQRIRYFPKYLMKVQYCRFLNLLPWCLAGILFLYQCSTLLQKGSYPHSIWIWIILATKGIYSLLIYWIFDFTYVIKPNIYQSNTIFRGILQLYLCYSHYKFIIKEFINSLCPKLEDYSVYPPYFYQIVLNSNINMFYYMLVQMETLMFVVSLLGFCFLHFS